MRLSKQEDSWSPEIWFSYGMDPPASDSFTPVSSTTQTRVEQSQPESILALGDNGRFQFIVDVAARTGAKGMGATEIQLPVREPPHRFSAHGHEPFNLESKLPVGYECRARPERFAYSSPNFAT